jgi:hypothetical protein
MKKLVLFFTALFLFSGCDIDLFNTDKVDRLKQENSRLMAEKEAESIRLDHENSRITIEKDEELKRLALEGEIQKQKLNNDRETELARIAKEKEIEALSLGQELEKEKLLQETKHLEVTKSLELEKYLFGLLALLMLIISFFIYYYFKKRREDKLIAYNDNLRKYFLFKEHETRTKIAKQVLDTIAEGKLSKEDQANLIRAISVNSLEELPPTVTNTEVEIEMIEEKR